MAYTNDRLDEITDKSIEIVNGRFTNASDFASQAYDTAISFINELKEFVENIDINIDDDLTNIVFDDTVIDIGNIITDKPVKDLPAYSTLNTPTNIWTYSDEAYVSSLLSQIKNVVSSELTNGSTGLSANVETAIQAREGERDELINQEALDKISSDWAEKGWGLPNAVLISNLNQIHLEYQNKQLDKSRTIEERSETLAIENRKVVLDKIMQIEGMLITLHDKTNDRLLEAAKQAMSAMTITFEWALKKFGLRLDVYKTDAQVYESTSRAAVSIAQVQISKFEATITQIKAKADIAIQKINILLKEADMKLQPQLEAIRAGAAVAAQLAAGALAGISASASIQAGASSSGSISSSDSNNYTEQHVGGLGAAENPPQIQETHYYKEK